MRYAPLLAALALLIAYGVAEGLWTHRWLASDDIPRAVARLEFVPRTVRDWEGRDAEMPTRQIERAEMDGHVSRAYVNRKTGQAVRVLLVCGRAGPTSLHSPEVCYEGIGYNPVGAKERLDIPAHGQTAAAEFWAGHFKKEGPLPEPMKIAWGWSTGGSWRAPEHPRFEFASAPVLFKLYVSQRLDDPGEDVCAEFLQAFLPELDKGLFARAAPSAAPH